MKMIVRGLAVEYVDEGQATTAAGAPPDLSRGERFRGPTTVMLHGWGDNLHTFDALVRQMPGYRIVRLDLPGFGQSERPREAWGVEEYALFVANFLKKLSIDSYVLVGHSFGGRIAIRGVGTKMLSPSKVVLIASAGVKKTRTLKNYVLRVVAKAVKALTLVWPLSRYRQQIRKRLYGAIGSDYFAAGSMRDIYLKVVAEDLLPFARQIAVPTLLIWGKNDRSTPLEDGQRIHAAIAGSTLRVFEGTHFVHQERAVEIAEAIKEFV